MYDLCMHYVLCVLCVLWCLVCCVQLIFCFLFFGVCCFIFIIWALVLFFSFLFFFQSTFHLGWLASGMDREMDMDGLENWNWQFGLDIPIYHLLYFEYKNLYNHCSGVSYPPSCEHIYYEYWLVWDSQSYLDSRGNVSIIPAIQ